MDVAINLVLADGMTVSATVGLSTLTVMLAAAEVQLDGLDEPEDLGMTKESVDAAWTLSTTLQKQIAALTGEAS